MGRKKYALLSLVLISIFFQVEAHALSKFEIRARIQGIESTVAEKWRLIGYTGLTDAFVTLIATRKDQEKALLTLQQTIEANVRDAGGKLITDPNVQAEIMDIASDAVIESDFGTIRSDADKVLLKVEKIKYRVNIDNHVWLPHRMGLVQNLESLKSCYLENCKLRTQADIISQQARVIQLLEQLTKRPN